MKTHISRATLATLSVTISSMQVNDKQMTLSVFRQLPELFELKNVHYEDQIIWGYVRYPVKYTSEFGKSETHELWLVGSIDGFLYREWAAPSGLEDFPQLFIAV